MDLDKGLVGGLYFRRDGTPYKTMREWAKDFENQDRHIAKTTLWWGGYVSTVWLGLNHNYFGGKPLIFETMIFYHGFHDLDMDRYSTEAEAIAGHAAMVKRWRFNIAGLGRELARDAWSSVKRWGRGR